MQIRVPKSWELPERAVTPEGAYRSRRAFLRDLSLLGAAAGAGAVRARADATSLSDRLNPLYRGEGLKVTPYPYIVSYNNFYEFGTDKSDPKENANKTWKPEPGWTVEIAGLAANRGKWGVEDIVAKAGGLEQRVYRFRCVEAWSMVIPWDGFPLAKLVAFAQPHPEAKYLKFTSFFDPKDAVGQADENLPYPYIEGLTLPEATNELAFIATGLYGRPLPNQDGAPIRLVVPWKYGFKSIKSITKIEFTRHQPENTWQRMSPDEYGFYANVNPNHDHPRWSQATERVIGAGFFSGRQPTLMFNGYGEQVASLYQGLDLDRYF